nr:amine dehydrogenase large subunit [Komagataeibacter europaeus]
MIPGWDNDFMTVSYSGACRNLFGLFLCGLVASTALSPTMAVGAEPVLQTEQSDTITLPAAGPHTILVEDAVYNHNKDGRVYVVDADHGRRLGMVQAAYNANVAQSPDGQHFYVAETTWAHGNRGQRDDLLVQYDPHTLAVLSDEKLPARALVTPKKNDLAISADGSRAYVYVMSPTNGVEVIDTHNHTVEQTVEVPGCALAYPWGNSGFSSLCADGTLANVSIGTDGKASLTHSAPFFVPDRDGVLEHSPGTHDGHMWFITDSGMVYPVKLGATDEIGTPWSLQQGAGMPVASDARAPFDVAWRPGGWQLAALHASSGELYVLMHRGTFWTHKEDGTEVWVFDTNTHKRVRRIPLPAASPIVGVTQDDHPLMFTSDEAGDLHILDARSGKLQRTMKHLGTDLVFTVAPGE